MSGEDRVLLLKAYLLDETPSSHIEELKEVFEGWHSTESPHVAGESGGVYRRENSGKMGEIDHYLTVIVGKIEQEIYERTDGSEGPFFRLIKDLAEICD